MPGGACLPACAQQRGVKLQYEDVLPQDATAVGGTGKGTGAVASSGAAPSGFTIKVRLVNPTTNEALDAGASCSVSFADGGREGRSSLSLGRGARLQGLSGATGVRVMLTSCSHV